MHSSQWFAYYSDHFRTVEANTSFYGPPHPEMLEKWVRESPADFQVTMKASQIITHEKKLQGCKVDLDQQWRQFAPLKEKLSCVLFQLSPSIRNNLPLLTKFLSDLEDSKRLWPELEIHPRIAIEFRHASWYNTETFRMLRKHGCATVLHDMPRDGGWTLLSTIHGDLILESETMRMTGEEWIGMCRESFLYLRFHGTIDGKERQEYGHLHLELWMDLAKSAMLEEVPLYAYFKNDPQGAAVRDALHLIQMLDVGTTRQLFPETLVQDPLRIR